MRNPFAARDDTWIASRAIVLAAVAVATTFVVAMLRETEGHFTAQTDDLYTVCQYARAMAEGHPYQYFPGEALTSGSTSFLHTAIIAAAHLLGARGEGLVAFAIAFGAVLFASSSVLAWRIGRTLAADREGVVAGLLVASCGPVVWGYMYGSDIALFMFVATLTFERWLALWRGASPLGYALAAALLALARPEGLLIAAALGAASLLRLRASRASRWLPFVPVLVALGLLAFHRALIGSWLATSLQEKSLFLNFDPLDSLALAATYGHDVARGLLLGFYPSDATIGFFRGWSGLAFPPLGLLAVLLAAAQAAAPLRRAVAIWLAVVATVFAVTGPNILMGSHYNRYLLWAFPSLLALAAVGLGIAARRMAGGEGDGRSLFLAFASLWLVLGLFSTIRFAQVYADNAGNMWRRDVATGTWIDRNLPPGASLLQASTSIDYLTRRRGLNLYGVTNLDFPARSAADTMANVYEGLARLPESRRPQYLLVTRSAYEGTALFGEIAPGPPLYESSNLGDELLVLGVRWDVVGRNHHPRLPATLAAVAGLTEVDSLNHGDPRDERSHDYRYASRLGGVRVSADLKIDDCLVGDQPERLADAGRLIVGSESFRVATRPGRDLFMVVRSSDTAEARFLVAQDAAPHHVRSAVESVAQALMKIEVGGEVAGTFSLANGPGWNEHVLRIPGRVVTQAQSRLRVSGRYAAYGYWFYQQP